MINKSFRLLCCVLLWMITSTLSAAQPSSAQINQLLEGNRSQQVFGHISTYIAQTVLEELQTTLPTMPLSEVDQQVVYATVGSSMIKAMTWEKMMPHYRQLYANTLDANQARVLLQFYRSPVGQVIVMAILEGVQNPEFMENPETIEPIIEQAIFNIDEKHLKEFLQLEQTHGVLQTHMQLFTGSLNLLQQKVTSTIEEVLTKELTELMK